MSVAHGNLADPDYEPSDEELEGLVHRAFSEAAARREKTMRRFQAEIEALRATVMLEYPPPPKRP
ncbi:MAG: hypothetical protein HOO96_28140 [Polyangiaceae bacterium]|nr:hypothetical protein [Polyangiaceae bacterium]